MLRFFTRMTALRSSKKLALSFLEMEQDDMNQIVTVPPLIRQEVTAIRPERVIIFMDIWLIPGLLIAWRVFMRNIRKFL